jgi:hypothetical protein
MKTIKTTLKLKTNQKGNKIKKNQPPKKNIDIKVDIIKILEYSAKKKRTNVVAAYSTLYPDTNSDSASGKSKGTLLFQLMQK